MLSVSKIEVFFEEFVWNIYSIRSIRYFVILYYRRPIFSASIINAIISNTEQSVWFWCELSYLVSRAKVFVPRCKCLHMFLATPCFCAPDTRRRIIRVSGWMPKVGSLDRTSVVSSYHVPIVMAPSLQNCKIFTKSFILCHPKVRYSALNP